jgi:hypothetical protein
MINSSMQALLIGLMNWALNRNPPPTQEQLHGFMGSYVGEKEDDDTTKDG